MHSLLGHDYLRLYFRKQAFITYARFNAWATRHRPSSQFWLPNTSMAQEWRGRFHICIPYPMHMDDYGPCRYHCPGLASQQVYIHARRHLSGRVYIEIPYTWDMVIVTHSPINTFTPTECSLIFVFPPLSKQKKRGLDEWGSQRVLPKTYIQQHSPCMLM